MKTEALRALIRGLYMDRFGAPTREEIEAADTELEAIERSAGTWPRWVCSTEPGGLHAPGCTCTSPDFKGYPDKEKA